MIVPMKKRDTAAIRLSVSKFHLQYFREVQFICNVIVQLFFLILGKVRLHNEQALHAGYMCMYSVL